MDPITTLSSKPSSELILNSSINRRQTQTVWQSYTLWKLLSSTKNASSAWVWWTGPSSLPVVSKKQPSLWLQRLTNQSSRERLRLRTNKTHYWSSKDLNCWSQSRGAHSKATEKCRWTLRWTQITAISKLTVRRSSKFSNRNLRLQGRIKLKVNNHPRMVWSLWGRIQQTVLRR